jgi:hypothetical protein
MREFQLPSIESVDTVPDGSLAATALHLTALIGRVAARLAAVASNGHEVAEEDRLLTVEEAARQLAVTEDWLRRRPDLPFVVKLSAGVTRYSRQGLDRYVATRVGRR